MTSVFQFLVFLAFYLCTGSPMRIKKESKHPTVDDFNVYWNVPTFMCQKYDINFEDVLKKHGIRGNDEDKFRGEDIVILYDPGSFPAVLRNSSGKLFERNGGIPQLGNLEHHLNAFRETVERAVPQDFEGVGVIDFEAWRPVFRQNWNEQVIYRIMSVELERQKRPQFLEKDIRKIAAKEFEKAAKTFMKETLKEAKRLRPNALWGYYAFPYCYNHRSHDKRICADQVEEENDGIQWMFDESTALFPSLYMKENLSVEDQKRFVEGRLNEARRVATKRSSQDVPLVFPYFWFKYYNTPRFLSEADIENALEITKHYKMGGAIIWGSSENTNTKEECEELFDYVENVLGPAVQKAKNSTDRGFVNMSFLSKVPSLIVQTVNQAFRPQQQQQTDKQNDVPQYQNWHSPLSIYA